MIRGDDPISNFMTPSPHSIGIDQSIASASRRMQAFGIRHLPVLEGGVLRGVLSERDIALVEAMEPLDPERVTVEEAMTPEPYAVQPTTPLRDVVRTMAERKYGSAVIVEYDRPVGVFTTIDALRLLERML